MNFGPKIVNNGQLEVVGNPPISRQARIAACQKLIVRGDYRLYNEESPEFEKLLVSAQSAVREHGYEISAESCRSLRQLALKDKIINNYGRMNNIVSVASTRYNMGEDILNLSHEYDFPPVNLLKGIFLHNGHNARKVNKMFSKLNPSDELWENALIAGLSGFDKQNVIAAAINDAESSFNQRRSHAAAIDYEKKFADLLISMGVDFVSEAELIKKQVAEFGRPLITPDFLLKSEVYYKSKRIFWIDVKNYFYYRGTFLDDKLFAQCEKYEKEFGPGALLFAYGREDASSASCIFV